MQEKMRRAVSGTRGGGRALRPGGADKSENGKVK